MEQQAIALFQTLLKQTTVQQFYPFEPSRGHSDSGIYMEFVNGADRDVYTPMGQSQFLRGLLDSERIELMNKVTQELELVDVTSRLHFVSGSQTMAFTDVEPNRKIFFVKKMCRIAFDEPKTHILRF